LQIENLKSFRRLQTWIHTDEIADIVLTQIHRIALSLSPK